MSSLKLLHSDSGRSEYQGPRYFAKAGVVPFLDWSFTDEARRENE